MKKYRSIKQKITIRIVLIGMITFTIPFILSYFFIIPALEQSALDTVETISNEIMQKLDSHISYVMDYTETLSLSVEQNQQILAFFDAPSEMSLNKAALDLNKLVSNNGVVRAVIIESEDGNALNSLNQIMPQDYSVVVSQWCQNIKDAKYAQGISSPYPTQLNGKDIMTAAYAKNFYYKSKKYTYVTFFNLDETIYACNQISASTLDNYHLVDNNGAVFHAWRTDDALAQGISAQLQDPAKGVSHHLTSIYSKWQVMTFVSSATIAKSYQSYIVTFFFIMLSFLVITLIALPKSLSSIINPITNLAKVMRKATGENLECTVRVDSNDEIGDLSRAYNNMLTELKRSMDIITEQEKQEQRNKFSLLISQVNPHFIYNTLNSINYLARRGACEDIIVVNSALISILQDMLRINDLEFMDSVAKEVQVTKAYISVQRYIYGGNLQVHWTVDETLENQQIPKNIIQPLVENAIFHGLIREDTGELEGEIHICIQKSGTDILVTVADDGVGMSQQKLRQLQNPQLVQHERARGKNIGIGNIRARLQYLYGSSDCMCIESAPGTGTKIQLRLGVLAQEAEDIKMLPSDEE